jgi:hypothetical protein
MGARLCVEIENSRITSTKCPFKEEYPRPPAPPPAPTKESIADRVELAFDAMNNQRIQMEIRIRELETALRFYADEYNYKTHDVNETLSVPSPISMDTGKRAQKTLYGD